MVLDLDFEIFLGFAAWVGGLRSFTPSIAADEGKALRFVNEEERNTCIT